MESKNTNQVIKEMIAVLSQEMTAYNELLEALHEKQRAIIESNLPELNASMEKESQAIKTAKSVTKNRNELQKDLPAENLDDVWKLIQAVEKKYADRLENILSSLENIQNEIKSVNEQNHLLLEHSIEFVKKVIRGLVSSMVRDYSGDYDATGHNKPDTYQPMMDRKI